MRRPGLLFLAAALFLTKPSLLAQTPTSTYVAPSFDKQQQGKVRAIDPSQAEFKIQKLASDVGESAIRVEDAFVDPRATAGDSLCRKSVILSGKHGARWRKKQKNLQADAGPIPRGFREESHVLLE